MKTWQATLVVFLPLAWTPTAGATDWPRARATDFIGLWEGVDAGDGSLTQRSITCDGDGLCEILGADQFFSFCPGSEGRGILRGSGTIEGESLVVPGFSLTCADSTVTSVNSTFTLDRRNGTLGEQTDNPGIAPIDFHRLSSRVHRRR